MPSSSVFIVGSLSDPSSASPGYFRISGIRYDRTLPRILESIRDTEEEEHSDVTWQDTIDRLTQRIPVAEPLPIVWHRPDVVQQTISRLRPYKAPGIDGWRAEEFRLLPPSAIASLAHIFSQIWHQGLHKDHMIARVVLLAKTKSTRGNRRWASHNDFRLHISTDVQDHRRSVAQILGSTLASSHCRWFTA